MIDWLAFFGATESNGVTRILYSKERMSAQQAMKLRVGKNLLYILIVYALGGPPVESF